MIALAVVIFLAVFFEKYQFLFSYVLNRRTAGLDAQYEPTNINFQRNVRATRRFWLYDKACSIALDRDRLLRIRQTFLR